MVVTPRSGRLARTYSDTMDDVTAKEGITELVRRYSAALVAFETPNLAKELHLCFRLLVLPPDAADLPLPRALFDDSSSGGGFAAQRGGFAAVGGEGETTRLLRSSADARFFAAGVLDGVRDIVCEVYSREVLELLLAQLKLDSVAAAAAPHLKEQLVALLPEPTLSARSPSSGRKALRRPQPVAMTTSKSSNASASSESEDDGDGAGSTTIAHFDPSRDSKNNYKGVGLKLFHNREKTRDAFLSHLHRQLDAEASLNQGDASKRRAESYNACRSCLTEVDASCRWWFASFFVQTMVRVCIEQPFAPISEQKILRKGSLQGGGKGKVAGTFKMSTIQKNLLDRRLNAPSPLRRQRSSERIELSARGRSSGRGGRGGGRGRGRRSGGGRGGRGGSSGSGGGGRGRGRSATRSSASQSSAALPTIENLFSPRENLFVDFVRANDSASLSSHLSTLIEVRLRKLCEIKKDGECGGKRWKQLRLLGKFLGFLHFSPRWFTVNWSSLSENSPGFVVYLSDVCKTIELAPAPSAASTIKTPHTLGAIVWVTAYLRSAELDVATLGSSTLLAVLRSLRAIYRAPPGTTAGGGFSRARLAAACAIEHMCELVKEGLYRRGLGHLASPFDLTSTFEEKEEETESVSSTATKAASASSGASSSSAHATSSAVTTVTKRSPAPFVWAGTPEEDAIVSRRAVQRMSPFLSDVVFVLRHADGTKWSMNSGAPSTLRKIVPSLIHAPVSHGLGGGALYSSDSVAAKEAALLEDISFVSALARAFEARHPELMVTAKFVGESVGETVAAHAKDRVARTTAERRRKLKKLGDVSGGVSVSGSIAAAEAEAKQVAKEECAPRVRQALIALAPLNLPLEVVETAVELSTAIALRRAERVRVRGLPVLLSELKAHSAKLVKVAQQRQRQQQST